jgi:hypothetical protein
MEEGRVSGYKEKKMKIVQVVQVMQVLIRFRPARPA